MLSIILLERGENMKRVFMYFAILALGILLFPGCKKGQKSTTENWPDEAITVICPWAVGGVTDVVNRKIAPFGIDYFGKSVLSTNELGAGGNVALTNYLKNKPNSSILIFGAEGAFSIAPNVPGSEALQFKYSDFIPIINLYSSIFVMTADAKLGINNLDDLKAYSQSKKVKVAVNGTASSEAFLAMSLFKDLGIGLELVAITELISRWTRPVKARPSSQYRINLKLDPA
jgi:tripartite-type tricarboxylate transporter receptor subunit TctC